ncbi:NYN domain-containing protein [bacterium]|nr:NYN domain-containing protein [bacterium]
MAKSTYVYIDGFNFYYGVFHKRDSTRSYKWIDYVKLSELLLQGYDIIKVKYFTALVDSHWDSSKSTRQQCHWKAMESIGKQRLQIILGNYRTDPLTRPIAKCQYSTDKNSPTPNAIWIINKEEKGSDVNLATHLVFDGCRNLYETALVMTNDSDLTEALRIVTKELGKEVILLNPHAFRGKPTSRPLQLLGLNMRTVRMGALRAAQLPDPIPGTNIHKPLEWK